MKARLIPPPVFVGYYEIAVGANETDSHERNSEERAVFAGAQRAGGGNEGIAGGCRRRRRVSLECVVWLVEWR